MDQLIQKDHVWEGAYFKESLQKEKPFSEFKLTLGEINEEGTRPVVGSGGLLFYSPIQGSYEPSQSYLRLTDDRDYELKLRWN